MTARCCVILHYNICVSLDISCRDDCDTGSNRVMQYVMMKHSLCCAMILVSPPPAKAQQVSFCLQHATSSTSYRTCAEIVRGCCVDHGIRCGEESLSESNGAET
jgi:hypothetical protein